MAPSLDSTEVELNTKLGNVKRKREKRKDSTVVIANAEACEDSRGFTKKKDKKRGHLTGELVELVAKYLCKRGLSKTLSALVSETQCENGWETQTLDLEDIYSHYSNQNSKNSLKHKAEKRNLEQAEDALSRDFGKQNEDVMSQEEGFKTNEGIIVSKKVVNKKEVSTGSGALKEGLSRSDKIEDFYDDNQDEHVQKKRKGKGVGKSIEPDSDNISAKKQCSGLPGSGDRENSNSTKDTMECLKSLNKSEKVLGLVESVHKSLKVPKEKRRKKMTTSEEKNSGDNELEKGWELDESLHGSLKVPKERREKKTISKEKDSGDGNEQGSGKKNKKEKKVLKKKLQSTGSHVTHGEGTDASVKDSTGDIGKSLDNARHPMISQAEEVVEEKAVKSVEASVNAKGFGSTGIDEQEGGIKGEENEGNIPANLKKTSKQISDVPTAANAFRRVKVEEVKFIDSRLQNNSYWAKGGAENGYGAKAEGVLGQVRGKDFRHEKTKKKRGSYKGGMIDLQSHSVKFNYSDEE